MMARTLSLFLLLLLAAVSCQTGKDQLGLLLDHDVIPVGSRVEFWIKADDDGWQESNIHILKLPRPMTGAEARRWAEGVGQRDVGLLWTHYYVLVTHPGPHGRTCRSSITARTTGYDRSARLQTPH